MSSSLLFFQKNNQNLLNKPSNKFIFFHCKLKNQNLIEHKEKIDTLQTDVCLAGVVKHFQKTQLYEYVTQLASFIKLFCTSLKQKPDEFYKGKTLANYTFYSLITASKQNIVTGAFSTNFTVVNLVYKHNQFYLSITNEQKRCLITCSSGSIANLTHSLALATKVDSLSWKKTKKSKSFFNTLIQTFQKLFLLQKLKIKNNVLVVEGSSRMLIDFLVIFEYSFFLKWFFFLAFKVKKSFYFKSQKKKKAIKRRIFKKLTSLDKVQYKYMKLQFNTHIIQ